eukprot:12922152-Prorocentrum_lima.AAC.1
MPQGNDTIPWGLPMGTCSLVTCSAWASSVSLSSGMLAGPWRHTSSRVAWRQSACYTSLRWVAVPS